MLDSRASTTKLPSHKHSTTRGDLSEEKAQTQEELEVLLEKRAIELEHKLRTSLDNLCSIPVTVRYFPREQVLEPLSLRMEGAQCEQCGTLL